MNEERGRSLKPILNVLLSQENSVEERLRSLSSLGDRLYERDALEALMAHLPEEPAVAVREAILRLLLAAEAPQAKGGAAWRECLYRCAAFEDEASLRKLAAAGLAQLAGTDPEAEILLTTLLTAEFDGEIQRWCLRGLLSLARIAPATAEALISWATNAPQEACELLLKLFAKLDLSAAQRGLAALLTPRRPLELRAEIIGHLGTMPQLDAATTQALAQHFVVEPEPSLWVRLLVLLLSVREREATLPAGLLEEVLSQPERHLALPLLQPYLDANPDLLARLAEAYPHIARRTARMNLLSALSAAGSPDLIALGLRDENYWVRDHAIGLARGLIDRFPQLLVPALARALREEPNLSLRRECLRALMARDNPAAEIQDDVLERFPGESDASMRSALAQMVLRIPPTPANQDRLLKAYLAMLEDPVLSREAGATLPDKLSAFRFSNSAELEQTLLKLIRQSVDFDVFADLFPLAQAACPEPRRLLPVLIDALYRFIDHYPQEPLPRIPSMIRDFQGSLPELQQEIPYIVELTGESWLLEAASTDVQKQSIFEQILGHFRGGEFGDMRGLLKEGFENRVLRKSDITRLYLAALAHPELDDVLDVILPMMKEAGVVSPDITERSLEFLARYPVGNSAAHTVTRYLAQFGSMTPGYLDKVRGLLTQENFHRLASLSVEPRIEGSIGRPAWQLFNLLPSRETRPVLRALLRQPLETAPIPPSWRFQDFALASLGPSSQLDLEDFTAVALFLGQARDREGLGGIADRASALLAERWPDLRQEQPDAFSPEIVSLVTDVFGLHIERWLELGGLSYPERVRPMPGIAIDHLRATWRKTPDQWDAFLQGYESLLGPDGLDEIPPAPSDRTLPPPSFAPLNRSSGLRDIVDFLVSTAPPSDRYPEDRLIWRRMLGLARENFPRILADVMEATSESSRSRVLTFLAEIG